jgi:alkylated DNA repair dioxygenase AlkB
MLKEIPYIINDNGEAIYFGKVFSEESIVSFFNELLNKIEWRNEEVIMFGKTIITKRKVAFYSNEGISYTYSNKTKTGVAWTPVLWELKAIVESHTHCKYNACLLNLYHNGDESMGWHSDDEKEIVPNSSIASISLGATRKFSFKNKVSKETLSVLLENGSLLEMKGALQKNWLHALPKASKINTPRINLTFRQMMIK